MKIINYQYNLYIRNKKEPISLDRIEGEALMVALAQGSGERFITIPVQLGNKKSRYFINKADIVLIEPIGNWYKKGYHEEIELSEREKKIHEVYLEKVEKASYLELPSPLNK